MMNLPRAGLLGQERPIAAMRPAPGSDRNPLWSRTVKGAQAPKGHFQRPFFLSPAIFALLSTLCYHLGVMKTLNAIWSTRRDTVISTAIGMVAFLLYLRTLAPSVVFIFDDTLEMQYVVPRLGILHPTGYPLYTILGKLFTLSVPFNDAAFRVNLFSAFCAALAVALVYHVAHSLVHDRVAALIAALTLAVSETFWAQAVIAEVYALQMLLTTILLYLTLHYSSRASRSVFYALALTMGLGLTHHRLIVLLFPAIALYLFLVNRNLLHDWKTLGRAAMLFCAPLLLYLYLPLRASAGSADGKYVNTLTGFFNWVMASQYTAFFENPLQVQHDAAFYWTMFQNQFTLAGLGLGVIGSLALWRQPREWILLAVALVATAGFALKYKTADVQVHFLTTFLLLALGLAAGIATLSRWLTSSVLRLMLSVVLWFIPLQLLTTHYATNDLSHKWDVYDYGRDLLAQPLEANATIIGITGEMTLIRYFQENVHRRPDIETIAADQEEERLAALERALQQNRAVYLTRPLPGAPAKYSLSSLGPLIRVHPVPNTHAPQNAHPLDEHFGAATLIGYAIQTLEQHAENGRALRVTLYWRVEDKIENDALVSVKLLRSDQRVFGQSDHRPVRDAYPTTAWRPGEIIADAYDVPIFFGATPGEYTIHVTLYDATRNAILGQANVGKMSLTGDTSPPRRDRGNIAHLTHADFGVLSLVGYSLDAQAPLRPGDALPLTLLWRAGWQKIPDNLVLRVWLEDTTGRPIASRETLPSMGYPPFMWQPNTYVRDMPVIRPPANLPDGIYTVKLAIVQDNQWRGSSLLPFLPTIVDLGKLEIKNRARRMEAPLIPHALEATFDQKIKLLGYAWESDSAQLTLYWRALASMDTPYTIFVHLLDAQNRVLAYGDAEPGNGTLPTTGWIENEYIVDPHPLVLGEVAPGTYALEIGVYDPATGARLKTSDGQESVRIEVSVR